jgi:hypothetical protein
MDWERRDDWNKSGREGQRENMNRSLREYESDCRLGERWVAGSETVAGESDCRWGERENTNSFNNVFCWGKRESIDYIQVAHLSYMLIPTLNFNPIAHIHSHILIYLCHSHMIHPPYIYIRKNWFFRFIIKLMCLYTLTLLWI